MRLERVKAFLAAEGAGQRRHAGDRTLLDHLLGSCEVVRRWNQPVELQLAALLHSVYGTDVYERPLIPLSRRPEVIELAGERAERLAYLFGAVRREFLFAGTHRWAREVPLRAGAADGERPPARDELDALVLLHMANLAEQRGMARPWLVKVRELGELLADSERVRPPAFVAQLADLSPDEETQLRDAYLAGIAELDAPERAGRRLGLAAAVCGVVPEPCVWQAYLAHCAGEVSIAKSWARQARGRLSVLGVPWDKRLTLEEWLSLAQALEQPRELPQPSSALADPRSLLDAVSSGRATAGDGELGGGGGAKRFQRYVESFTDGERVAALGIYPELESRPWYDPQRLALARYLERHSEEIRDEVHRLDTARFQPERERIRRSGDWDVVFLYERGRRHDDVCEACPVTTRGIEEHDAMRTAAGLIYVSRMRAGTHIHAHRGPTNLRLRCHLGIQVPTGDCAIRVSDETRRWVQGRCLVFDDHYEHEAWNHTEDDRIVLIADLWHPSLSRAEVRLLEGLHRYAFTYARQLGRYWANNAAATSAAG